MDGFSGLPGEGRAKPGEIPACHKSIKPLAPIQLMAIQASTVGSSPWVVARCGWMDGWMDGWMVDGVFFGCKDGRWWKNRHKVDGNKYWAKKEVLEFDLKTIWGVVS